VLPAGPLQLLSLSWFTFQPNRATAAAVGLQLPWYPSGPSCRQQHGLSSSHPPVLGPHSTHTQWHLARLNWFTVSALMILIWPVRRTRSQMTMTALSRCVSLRARNAVNVLMNRATWPRWMTSSHCHWLSVLWTIRAAVPRSRHLAISDFLAPWCKLSRYVT